MNIEGLKKKLSPVINESTNEIMEMLSKKGIDANREDIKLGVSFDLYRCLSNYITNDDDIKLYSVKKHPMTLSMGVKRNGEYHSFSTERIIAGGSIQRLHYRYIPHTSLRKLDSKLKILEDIEKKQKFRSKLEKLQSEVDQIKLNIKKRKELIRTEKAKTKKEVCAHVLSFEWHGQPNFDNKAHWEKWIKETCNEQWEMHKENLASDIKQMEWVRDDLLAKAQKKVDDHKKEYNYV
jgi:hypothetical protein